MAPEATRRLAAIMGTALLIATALIAQAGCARDETRLGHVDFAVSCNPEAQAAFHVAIAWLHSFEYERAEAAFREVLNRDAACAMAYWGMAMSRWHPLWVPPSQAETMVAALREKGIPVAYVPFEGEQHGFRKAENIIRAIDGEYFFFARIFGFAPADDLEPVPIDNLPAS